jgi:hypothetical protein
VSEAQFHQARFLARGIVLFGDVSEDWNRTARSILRAWERLSSA